MTTAEPLPARRAPYGDRPDMGAKGLRTQQRILDAALRVFGTNGYDRATLDAIAAEAGCSRVAIYQYFEGKDDIFRHLAGQVARQLRASMDVVSPITADADGEEALNAWVTRYADIHARFEPVFRAFGAAAASDATLAGGAALVSERSVSTFLSRVSGPPRPGHDLDTTVALILGAVSRALDIAAVLRRARPDVYPRDRVDRAIGSAVRRALFAVSDVAPPDDEAHEPVPRLTMSDELRALFTRVGELRTEALQPGRDALARLLDAADDVVAAQGYRGVRVDHVVSAAGVSRGAFYRYFANVDDFIGVIGVRAVDDLSQLLREPPDPADGREVRAWLEQYFVQQAAKGTLTRVWMEAVADANQGDRAAVYDWGRRQLAGLITARPGRDTDVDSLILLATIESIGAAPRTVHEVDVAVALVERTFLGATA